MATSIQTAPQADVISIAGQMDAEGVMDLRPLFEEVVVNSGRDVTLDISEVTYMDGSGVGAIAFAFKRMAARGLKLGIEGAQGQPLSLLRRLGLERTLGLPAATPARRHGWAAMLGIARAA